jgi:monothiol glutaredoxin
MKGNANAPQCGFSARVVEVLNHQGVDFKTFDILSDGEIRQGLKEYSNWPTYPQLYIKGKLIGGCDIVMELAESGELASVIKA